MGKEIWKPIPEYEGLYDVSTLGRIRHLPHRRRNYVKILNPRSDNGKPYLRINLCKFGQKKRFSVHRLVLFSFVGPAPDFCEAAHSDGNPTNNKLTNLKWCTREENSGHRKLHGTSAGSRNAKAVLTEKQVKYIRRIFVAGHLGVPDSGNSLQLSRKYGVNRHTIYSIVNRKTWKHL